MKFERAWETQKGLEAWKEIDADRAQRELANQHGDGALEKLTTEKTLKTRFAQYRIVD